MNIDLSVIARALLKNFRLWLITGAAGLLAGVVYLHLVHYKYNVTLEITPVQSSAGGSVSGMLGGLSGLANLAGVNLPADSGARQFDLYIIQLTSPVVASDLLKDPRIARHIFASRWDTDANGWKMKRGIVSSISAGVRYLLGAPVHQVGEPSVEDMRQVLINDVHVLNQRGEATEKIIYADSDVDFAKYFLLQLHHDADERMRARMVGRSQRYIDFIDQELQTVTSTEQRQALIQTLTEQERSKMFAGAKVSYAVDVFNPPVAPNDGIAPKPFSTLAMLALVGVILGMAWVLVATRLGVRDMPEIHFRRLAPLQYG